MGGILRKKTEENVIVFITTKFQIIQNHHQNTRFRSLTDRLCCIVVEIKIKKKNYVFLNVK